MKREALGHTKIGRLQRRLAIERWGAVGILESLWHLTAREAPSGNVGKLPDEDIAYSIGWGGDPATLIRALVETGWVDEHREHRLVIHDWGDHADDAVHLRLARAGQVFADGRTPNLARLTKTERRRLKALYERTASAGKRTASALPEPEPCQAGALQEPGPDSPGREQGAGVSKVPVLVAEDGFEEFRQACEAAGMSGSDVDWAEARLEWRRLDFEQRAAATQGIRDRVSAGEYSDPAFVPRPLNYLRRRKWQALIRDKRAGAKAGFSVAEEMRGL